MALQSIMLRSRLTQELYFGLMDDGFTDTEPSGIIGPFLGRLADSLSTGDRCWLRLSHPLRWRSPEIRRIDCGGHIVALGLPRNPASPPTTPGWIAVETLFNVVTVWDLDSRRQIQQQTGTLHAMNADWETIWHHQERDTEWKCVGLDKGDSCPIDVTGLRAAPDSDLWAGVWADPYKENGRIVIIRPAEPDGEKDVFVFSEAATAVRWLPAGLWLLSIHGSSVHAWDMDRLPQQPDGMGHPATFESVAWSPDGETVCIQTHHSNLALWKSNGTVERMPFQDASAVWGRTTNHLWVGDGAGKARISLIDSEQGGTSSWTTEGDRIAAIAFDPATERLGIGSVQSGRVHLSVWHSSRPGRLPWKRKPCLLKLWALERPGYEVNAVSWQPTAGNLLAVSIDGKILLFSGDSGRVEKTLSGFSRKTPQIHLFGATILEHESRPEPFLPTADVFAWHPDGKWLAAASLYGSLMVWDLETEGFNFTWQVGDVSDCPFHALAWIPRTRWLATGSADGWLRIWNGMTGDCVAGCDCGGPIKAIWCDGENSGRLRVLVEMETSARFLPVVIDFVLETQGQW